MPKETSSEKRPSIGDVARRASVGVTSVSRFLKARRRMELSWEVRERIEKAIRELDYVPYRLSRKKRLAKATFTFGILTSLSKDIFHSRYHTEILSGIFDEIGRTSHELKFFLLKDRHYERLEEVLYDHGVDGLLILTWRIHPKVVRLVEKSKAEVPLVVFNDCEPKLRVNILYTDVREGVKKAVHYLVEKGYRRIGMLRGPTDILFHHDSKTLKVPSIDSRDKFQGFLTALREKRTPLNKRWIRPCASYGEGDGYHEMKALLKERSRPDAVVCANDDIAIGALRALRESRVKCPRDLALIGFDDIEKARLVSPALTTVRQPLYQMGRDAVDILIEKVKTPGREPEQKRYLPELVIRSTA